LFIGKASKMMPSYQQTVRAQHVSTINSKRILPTRNFAANTKEDEMF
jgi:hypothetical protein